MAISLKRQKGFTLVEAIVAGMVAAIIAGFAATLIYMVGSQSTQSSLQMKLLMQYEIAAEQMARVTRNAHFVLAEGETFPPWNNAALTTNAVQMYSIAGVRTGGFKINGTTLQEWSLITNQWVDFKINPADSGVKVLSASGFTLSPSRTDVTLGVGVVATAKSKKDTITSGQELIACRN
jgi:type II secretory pathway pseudopilin PulG